MVQYLLMARHHQVCFVLYIDHYLYDVFVTGKTYTMMGDDDNPGVMVLAAKDIFREIELATDRQFLLR